jgi:hypothetical protein
MGGFSVDVGTHRIVRQCTVTQEVLEKIADLLGMDPALKREIISGTQAITIHRGPPSTSVGGGSPATAAGGSGTGTSAAGGTRQSG